MDKAECWPVAPGEDWHGFKDADADHISRSGEGHHSDAGHGRAGIWMKRIPAALVAKFLDERGVVVENRPLQSAVPVQYRHR
ncbi:hypothetical protein ACL655_02630 [Klebsiella quasipneumoniae subsp. similipneumoniae]